MGLEGLVDGQPARLGRRSWCRVAEDGSSTDSELWFRIGDDEPVRFAFEDEIRADARERLPAVIEAPVATGQPLGEIKVMLNDEVILQEQLRALGDNPSGSFWQRTVDTVMLWME